MYFYSKDITKSYENEIVIENINIGAKKGEIISLLGLSGIGKTTLFNVLSGLETPDSGKVILNGNDITATTGKVGYMQQNDLLMPFKTIIDNVCIPLTIKGTSKKEARKIASPLFLEFGLEGYQNKYPRQLSGGMRQRAALLRSHLIGNDVILLDEPFSALDTFTKSNMHTWFLSIAKKNNNTAIFITHDIDEAIYLSDRIYIMSGIPGKITKAFDGLKQDRNLDFTTCSSFTTLKQNIISCINTI